MKIPLGHPYFDVLNLANLKLILSSKIYLSRIVSSSTVSKKEDWDRMLLLAMTTHCHIENMIFFLHVYRGRNASNAGVCPLTWSPHLHALLLQCGAHPHQAVTLPILAWEAIDSESIIRANTRFTITHFWQVTLIFCWSAHRTSLFKL